MFLSGRRIENKYHIYVNIGVRIYAEYKGFALLRTDAGLPSIVTKLNWDDIDDF
ncbi:hypothetical protein UABAM_01401 [Candidatus Uabimicrobium amorphum]|uniref:Uncharacterized protein n=1 Tax=Uabimicrobium amorphum TaxID=2596890 RepID=A0A5S9IKI8_UABAM|nr:hypothetical protein UABAM_01401 [Candidatus Uabimicrobium amorphum]